MRWVRLPPHTAPERRRSVLPQSCRAAMHSPLSSPRVGDGGIPAPSRRKPYGSSVPKSAARQENWGQRWRAHEGQRRRAHEGQRRRAHEPPRREQGRRRDQSAERYVRRIFTPPPSGRASANSLPPCPRATAAQIAITR